MTLNKPLLITPDWPAPDTIRALSTTRLGGCSQKPYAALNLGLHVGDKEEDVLSNREHLKSTLSIASNPCWLNQTHSADVIKNYYDPTQNNADAMISDKLGQVCAVMTADCLPVLLTNSEGTEVAAVHAGWRGLHSSILKNTLSKMSSDANTLLAWLGPCICTKHYQVGLEIFQLITEQDHQYSFAFIKADDTYYLSLQKLATIQLQKLGVRQIFQSEQCTFDNEQHFFSYRRDKTSGRMASLIWII